MLRIVNVTKTFNKYSADHGETKALQDVSLHIKKGESFGLVGESGAGKTTLGMCIAGLETPTMGSILFQGMDMASLGEREKRAMRKRIQMVWQDPLVYLNPYMKVSKIVREPLENYFKLNRTGMKTRVRELLDRVGLDAPWHEKYPHQLSGGQCRRVSVARVLAVEPELLICDEPLSALDMSARGKILQLLKDLREKTDVTFLFITHDLWAVREFCSRIGVMAQGRIVEQGETMEIFSRPRHEYTKRLMQGMHYLERDFLT